MFAHDSALEPAGKSSTKLDEAVQRTDAARSSNEKNTKDEATQDTKTVPQQSWPAPNQSRIVSKPVPQAQSADPREFQIGQLRRRYSPEEVSDSHATSLKFKLQPSDPDFPFELDGLQCTLVVPFNFPKGKPELRVHNSEMERGYQINVERGFEMLAAQFPQKTLLALMNELDKKLESLLISQKAQTIKIVANAPSKVAEPNKISSMSYPPTQDTPGPLTMSAAPPIFDNSQKAAATSKRESDVRQLESRLGKQQLFSKSKGGTSFVIPMTIPKPLRLPISLQPLKSIVLLVPESYNLEPCSLAIAEVDSIEAHNVERVFHERAVAHPELSLMSHVNFLAQNMHLMAIETAPDPMPMAQSAAPSIADGSGRGIQLKEQRGEDIVDTEKSHVKVIPKPPEWSVTGESESDESTEYDEDSEYSDDEEGGAAVPAQATASVAEVGIALSFPSLELYGIDLLELTIMSLTIKCDRCKDTKDIKGIKATKEGASSTESCNKCALPMTIGTTFLEGTFEESIDILSVPP